MSVSGSKLSPKQNPVTHHAAALKQLAMPRSIPAKVQQDVCDTHAETGQHTTQRSCTPLTHPTHSLVSYYTNTGISHKPGCLSALSRSANAAAGVSAMGAEDQSHEMRE